MIIIIVVVVISVSLPPFTEPPVNPLASRSRPNIGYPYSYTSQVPCMPHSSMMPIMDNICVKEPTILSDKFTENQASGWLSPIGLITNLNNYTDGT